MQFFMWLVYPKPDVKVIVCIMRSVCFGVVFFYHKKWLQVRSESDHSGRLSSLAPITALVQISPSAVVIQLLLAKTGEIWSSYVAAMFPQDAVRGVAER